MFLKFKKPSKDWIEEYYVKQGLGISKCAEIGDCSTTTISRAVRKYGIDPHPSPTRIEFSQTSLEEAYYERKLTIEECAKRFSCSATSIKNRMREWGLSARGAHPAVKNVSKAWLVQHYVLLDMTLAECADLYGCSHNMIQRSLVRHNIKRRPASSPGAKHHGWKGGISFAPYCPKFNKVLKEEIRNKYNRTCQKCGERENVQKLDVHHINFDKMAGCYGRPWNLIPLHRKCHSWTTRHRFDAFQLFVNHWATNPEINFNF